MKKQNNANILNQVEISKKAGELTGKIYNELLKQFPDGNNPSEETLKSLNMLCIRLVFCLYAEDANLFKSTTLFGDFLRKYDKSIINSKLKSLFEVLNTKEENRAKDLSNDLRDFPYVNGGLFAKNNYMIPVFTDELKRILIEEASDEFNWNEISPTIFGAIFESTLNPNTRKIGGMHYTSIENIYKILNPLFLNDLENELKDIKTTKNKSTKNKKLKIFIEKLSNIKIMDPACGSGNFLTESYLSLRRIENECLRILYSNNFNQNILFIEELVKVNIDQFYGIEINDFAVSAAISAMLIAECQMLQETMSITGSSMDFLPLGKYKNIIEENAITYEWNNLVDKSEITYIIGNPPFVGARLKDKFQKQDVNFIFKGVKSSGNIDYVGCWFLKAKEYMEKTKIKTAFVSTNSITQGEQVPILWNNMINDGIVINFAYKSFIWNNEAQNTAHVHCVIICFSYNKNETKIIFNDKNSYKVVNNIHPYIADLPNIFIEDRAKPLANVTKIGIGNKPVDGGNYLFTENEMKSFIEKEKKSEKYFKQWIGAEEFINNKKRFCLWLGDCSTKEINDMPHCKKIIESVRNFRLKSSSPGTIKLADKPTRFHVENMPIGNYIVIPKSSSEKRAYLPIGFLSPYVLASDALFILPNASIYDFGILTSKLHNIWIEYVSGKHGIAFRYSASIVYNNFPFIQVNEKNKNEIEKTAQNILDIRDKYSDSSLSDLYDKTLIPYDLKKAHIENDNAVFKAYGIDPSLSINECMIKLLKLYKKMSN